MNKIIRIMLGYILTAVITASCTKEAGIEEDKSTISTEEGVELNYRIHGFDAPQGASRAVSPTQEETTINNVLFLLFQFTGTGSDTNDMNEWECTGSTYQTNLSLIGETGKFSFKLPSSMDEKATYQVLVICNLTAYSPTSLESFGLRLHGQTLANVKARLTSTGMGKESATKEQIIALNRDFSSGTNLLMTGEFTFSPRQNVPLLSLNRKNVIYETNIKNIPEDVEIEQIIIHNFPLQTYLFTENPKQGYITADMTLSADAIQKLGSTFKLYYLPNSYAKEDMVSIELKYKVKEDEYTLSSKTGAPQFILSDKMSETKTQTFKMSIGTDEDNAGHYFAPNEYIRAVLFESVNKPNVMLMTINGWLTDGYKGVYQMSSDGTRGYSVSSDHLYFPFCRQEPMPSSQTSAFPDGSQSMEIFIAGHGVLPTWSIDLGSAGSLPSWLSVSNHISRSSVVVTIQPNLKIASDGSIISAPRLFSFNLRIGEATFPITVRQDAAPLYATDVTLPNGLTVSGKNYGATTANYYNNIGYWNDPKFIGDKNARGKFFNHTTWAAGGGSGDPDSGTGFSETCTKKSVAELETAICGSRDKFRLPTGKELALHIYPYIKYLKSNVDGRTADIYYLASEDAICFIPLTGNYAGVNVAGGDFAGAASAPYTKLAGWYGKDVTSTYNDGYKIETGKGTLQVLTYTGIQLGGNNQASANLYGGPNEPGTNEDWQYSTFMYRCISGQLKSDAAQ